MTIAILIGMSIEIPTVMSKGGWGGFSVPGHSGTQRKHRKAFANRQQHIQSSRRTKGQVVNGTYEARKKPHWIMSVLAGIGVLVICGAIFIIGKTFYSGVTQPLRYQATEKAELERYDTKMAYAKLLEMAQDELNQGNLHLAKRDFEKILAWQPANEAAQQGWIETVNQLCAEKNTCCDCSLSTRLE